MREREETTIQHTEQDLGEVTLTIRLSRSTTFLVFICLLASLVPHVSSSAADENPWQLLDFEDKEILGKIGITDEITKQIGIGIMQNALTRHRDTEVRATCAKVLGRFEAKSAGQALVWALRDPHADVREKAAEAILELKAKRAAKQLIQALSDPHEAEWGPVPRRGTM